MTAGAPATEGYFASARQSVLDALGRHDYAAATAAVQRVNWLCQQGGGSNGQRYAEVGDLWTLLGEQRAACDCYDRAIAMNPGEARIWFNRATVRRFLGELEAAEADYDQVIALSPGDAQAYLNRSELRPQSHERNHIEELERALLRASGHWQHEVPLRYALAKEYEDLCDLGRSWAHLSRGASLRRQNLEYDVRIDLATVDWLREAFPVGPPANARAAAPCPIFILGMPRTGSTLVDRMLGRHSQVRSAGELPDFGAALVSAVQQRATRKLSRRDMVLSSGGLDFAALGAEYLRRVGPRAGHTPYFTDKLPLNYLYCGLIARALPGARLVHVTRDAMATCFGMYKVLFDRGYPFSYDLRELADYYLGYRRLMAHWAATMPGCIVEVRYEKLVSDTVGELQRLFAALGLPWEDQCLDFQSDPRPVATASAAQVRRPIYAGAVSLWRNYAHELSPLAARLEAGGISLDT